MTVTNQINTVVYTGNGVTTQFDFSFRVDKANELEVILYTIATGREETLDPSEYSVTGIGVNEGGSVTYAPGGSPMASTHKLILRRVVPLTQDLDVTAQDGFNPEIYEDQLDRMVMMIQQISEKVNRAATLSAANSVDSPEDLLAATLTLANLEDEINTLAGIAANITTVAGISANVTTVAGVAAAVATLAGIAADVSTVAANDANVTTLAAIAGSITTLAGIAANVTTLAALDNEVTTLAGLDTELAAIYAALANISTVATSIANVNTVAGLDTEVTTLAALDTELAAIYAALSDIQAAVADLPSLAAKLNTDGSNLGDDAADLKAALGIANLQTILTKVPVTFKTVQSLIADEIMSYSPGQGLIEVSPGDVIEAGGFHYEVAASGTTGPKYIATAGGVSLLVLKDATGAYNLAAWGGACDAATDDSTLLNAISVYEAGGPKIIRLNGDTFLGSTVNVPWNTIIDGNGFRVVTSSGRSTEVFTVEKGGVVRNIDIDLLNGYTGEALVLTPVGAGIQGHQVDYPWAENVSIRLPVGGTANGLVFDATSYYIQYMRARSITVQGGADAVVLRSSGGATFCNGNEIDDLTVIDADDALYLSQARGNSFRGVKREVSNGACSVRLVNSTGNTFYGMSWDGSEVIADTLSRWNTFETETSNYPNISGSGSRFIDSKYAGGEQIAGVSRMFGHDYRMGFEKAQGRIEFVDDFLGKPSPYWTQSIVSGGSISVTSAFEGAAAPNSFMRRCTLDPDGKGTVNLSFGSAHVVTPRNNPTLHLIFNPIYSGSGNQRIGLANTPLDTPTDCVTLEVSSAFGDAGIRFITRSGGVSTVIDTDVVADSANYLFFATIEITPLSAILRLGRYNIASANATGAVGRGIDALYTTSRATYMGTWEITTNIPGNAALQPVANVTSTGAHKLQLSHFHLIAGMYAPNNA